MKTNNFIKFFLKKNTQKWVFFLIMLFPLHFVKAAPAPCTWVNPYDGDKTRTVTPQVLPNVGKDGNVQYESCDEAIDRDRKAVEKRHANRHANKHITGGSRNNCFWKEPLPPFKEHKVEVRQVGEKPDGSPKYESCRQAQWRKQEAWRDSEGWEHREDLEDAIKKYNEDQDKKILSSERELEKAAEKRELGSRIATGGSIAAGVQAAKCFSSCPHGCCKRAPFYAAISAGLGVTAFNLMNASNKDKDLARQYAGSLLNDPNNPNSTGTPGGPDDPGNITAGATTSGLPTSPPITPPSIPPVTLPDGNTVIPTPENIRTYLNERHNLDFDPEKRKITLPDGRSYTAEDMEKPEFRKFANSGAAADLKKQMKGLEKQITDQMGKGDIHSLAAGDSAEEEGLPGGAGGGGFGGYDGGSGFHDGEGGGTLIAGMGGGSSKGSKDADKSSKVAGMSVQAGKNRVGVAQDDIFEMIHRRYQNKRKKQQFIEFSP